MDMEMDDAIQDMNIQREIDEDLAGDFNKSDDYDDGDPWGEEAEDMQDYD